jgi:hypothetical protein
MCRWLLLRSVVLCFAQSISVKVPQLLKICAFNDETNDTRCRHRLSSRQRHEIESSPWIDHFLDSTSPIACIPWIRSRRKWRFELIILQHKSPNIVNIDVFISKRVFEMHEDELKIHCPLVRNFWNVQWCISSPGWNLCIRGYAETTKCSMTRLVACVMVIEFHQIIARLIPSLIWGQLLLTSPQD